MADNIRVYVDGEPVDVAPGATALDAITARYPAAANDIRSGARIVVDNRGLPTSAVTTVYQGAIYRVVSARQARDTAAE